MLDVHPAHHAASTWRDFFIHIATIVLGLLIAIGLERRSVLHGSRSDEQNLYTIYDAMDVYLHGEVPALLAKYPLPG